jgi:putative IMPACT (imprinted ancient) family translation regulator
LQKSSDDREPANTAGKPILRALLQADLTNIGIVVVRYFGGKLLGVPGLIEAYGAAAQAALENADITEKTIMERYQVVGHFESENEYYKITKQMGLKIIHHVYNQSEFNSIFEVRKQQADEAVIKIKEKRLFTITPII